MSASELGAAVAVVNAWLKLIDVDVVVQIGKSTSMNM